MACYVIQGKGWKSTSWGEAGDFPASDSLQAKALVLRCISEKPNKTHSPNFQSKTSVTRCLFKTVMEAQTGLQSGRLLASLWDFNRKDVAAVLRAHAL